MPNKRKLPINKEKRASTLEKVYLDLHFLPHDSARFTEILKQFKGQISLRTLKAYKKEYGWSAKMDLLMADRRVKISEIARTKGRTVQESKMAEVQRSTGEPVEAEKISADIIRAGYEDKNTTPEEKERIVREICDDYERGFDITEICDRHGLHHNTFATWVNENPVLEQAYKEAKVRHEASFLLLFQEKVKRRILNMIESDFIYEDATYFKIKYVPGEDGRMQAMRIDTHGVRRKIPNRIDGKTVEMFKELLRTMTLNVERNREVSTDKFSRMTTEELMLTLEQINQKLQDDTTP